MIETSSDERPQPDWRAYGRLGGLKLVATHDMSAVAARARAGKDGKWLTGHGCRVCGEFITIPESLPIADRNRRANALRRRHYILIGSRSRKR